jgi:transcriptional regulator NrdR family protein
MKARGYTCCGVPMTVTSTRKPTRNLIVRYRECLVCKSKLITEERISQTRKPTRPNNGTAADSSAD